MTQQAQAAELLSQMNQKLIEIYSAKPNTNKPLTDRQIKRESDIMLMDAKTAKFRREIQEEIKLMKNK